MDPRFPGVEPTPPPNLRRVKLRPTAATPKTNARTLGNGQTASPAASTPGTPRFARKTQMSAFEVFERNARGDPSEVPESSPHAARVSPEPLEAGRGVPNAGAERPREEDLPFSRGKPDRARRAAARTSSEETTTVPSRSRHAVGGEIHAVSPPDPNPHAACRECAEKDAAIARLTAQLARLRGCLGAVETLAERQAERETSSEHDLSRLERKLLAYREALRKHAETSPESSSDACPSPGGSRGGDERERRGRFPRVASGDELGLHKVHGGTRYRARASRGTGTGTQKIYGDDVDDGTMRE